jgi:predicted amidohydrolase YtcJ
VTATEFSAIVFSDVELVTGERTDVRLEQGLVAEVGRVRRADVDLCIDGRGGVLLPGLADHHLHLFALAAAAGSVGCGPPEVEDREGLATALRSAPGSGWVRGTGYAESVAGPLDRAALDALLPTRPVRVQERSGALWVLNSAAAAAVGLHDADHPGIERDASGAVTGRLWRADDWLRTRMDAVIPDLAAVGRRLAALGLTALTDATPDLDSTAVRLLCDASARGDLPQRLLLLGAPHRRVSAARVAVGPHKVLLHDHDLPTYDDLAAVIGESHALGRPVAVHCVTRESLLLTLAVLSDMGSVPGDRLEHAAVVPPEARATLAGLGLTVVTQPGFVATRGDHYLADVDAADLGLLYPYRSLLDAGVCVAPSSDAPFGDPDPWAALRAARDRRTRAGALLAGAEAVPVLTALEGLLSPLESPGGAPRRVEVGAAADLCLLHVPLAEALRAPDATLVRSVVCDGSVVVDG